MKKIFSFMYKVLFTCVSMYVFVGVIVGIHEYGHYREYVDLGIPLQEFSIGVGPKMFQVDGPSGMPINFRLLPLGGYVAPTDEGAEKFLQMHAGDQIQVMGAGILATLLLAMVLIWSIYLRALYKKKISGVSCLAMIAYTPFGLIMRFAAFLCSFFTLKRVDFSESYVISLEKFRVSQGTGRFISGCVCLSMFNALPFLPLDGGKVVIALLRYGNVQVSFDLIGDFSTTLLFLFVGVFHYAGKLNLTVVRL